MLLMVNGGILTPLTPSVAAAAFTTNTKLVELGMQTTTAAAEVAAPPTTAEWGGGVAGGNWLGRRGTGRRDTVP